MATVGVKGLNKFKPRCLATSTVAHEAALNCRWTTVSMSVGSDGGRSIWLAGPCGP